MLTVYETNSGLGYNQKAFLVKVKQENYLCIDTKNIISNDCYIIGKIVNIPDYCVSISNYNIKESPLWNDFLFQEFIKSKKVRRYKNAKRQRKNKKSHSGFAKNIG